MGLWFILICIYNLILHKSIYWGLNKVRLFRPPFPKDTGHYHNGRYSSYSPIDSPNDCFAVRSRYITGIFHRRFHKRHPIARPRGPGIWGVVRVCKVWPKLYHCNCSVCIIALWMTTIWRESKVFLSSWHIPRGMIDFHAIVSDTTNRCFSNLTDLYSMSKA